MVKRHDWLNVCHCKACNMFYEHINYLRLKRKSGTDRELFDHAHSFPNFCPWCGTKILKLNEIIRRAI